MEIGEEFMGLIEFEKITSTFIVHVQRMKMVDFDRQMLKRRGEKERKEKEKPENRKKRHKTHAPNKMLYLSILIFYRMINFAYILIKFRMPF